jgi:hypothetical protein
MTEPDDQRFKFIDPQGRVIGSGPLDELLAHLPSSRERKDAEQLIRDAAVAAGKVAEIDRRADAVAAQERQVAARERALREDAVRTFCDSVDSLARRLDQLEQRRIEAELAALPDPDSPGPLRHDHGELEPLEPSHPADREVLEAQREADTDAGPADLPNELQLPSAPLSEAEPAGLGVRSTQDARTRRFREPKPRKGRDWPALAVSLISEE